MRFSCNFRSSEERHAVNIRSSGEQFAPTLDSLVLVADTSKIPKYEGDFVIIPTLEDQTLETANRYVTNDISITAVPNYEVSNLQGGETFYICSEVL